ncbi:hypothetical protein EC973_007233 [Apophysomyces ossiformis]|uniref:DRBM domain-containing protein n=1 Tax=Apophysomyces ossiformis TaxID=679940 RepID=A0A8H7BQ06_9FUNG|nr:hypothetical protein EC973_007233 [Apophysomyces ossiformis]
MAYVQLLHTQAQRAATILRWDPKITYEFKETHDGFFATVEVLRHTFTNPQPFRSKKDAKECVSAIAFGELNMNLPNRRERPPSQNDMLGIIKIWLSASLQARQNAPPSTAIYPILLNELTGILRCEPAQYDRIRLDGSLVTLASVAGRRFGCSLADPQEAQNECARQAIAEIVQHYCDAATAEKSSSRPSPSTSIASHADEVKKRPLVDPTGKSDMAILNEVIQKMGWEPAELDFHEKHQGRQPSFFCELRVNRGPMPPIHIDQPTWHRSKDIAKRHSCALAIQQLCHERILHMDR